MKENKIETIGYTTGLLLAKNGITKKEIADIFLKALAEGVEDYETAAEEDEVAAKIAASLTVAKAKEILSED